MPRVEGKKGENKKLHKKGGKKAPHASLFLVRSFVRVVSCRKDTGKTNRF